MRFSSLQSVRCQHGAAHGWHLPACYTPDRFTEGSLVRYTPRVLAGIIARRFHRKGGERAPSLDMSLRDWLAYHQQHIVFDRVTWMGIPAQKLVTDAWVYQEILYEVRPDVVIEIGSNQGGSTLFLCHMLDLIGHGFVVSVDIDRSIFRAKHPRLVCITGDSAAPETVNRVRHHCKDRRVLVIHDGDHFKDHVRKDMEAYAPLVAVGSYLIVEDAVVDVVAAVGGDYIRPGKGPLPAIEAFLSAHPEFVVDVSRERYIATYNPRGYLKRIH
jgi:cephalosporin hydroxylase